MDNFEIEENYYFNNKDIFPDFRFRKKFKNKKFSSSRFRKKRKTKAHSTILILLLFILSLIFICLILIFKKKNTMKTQTIT